MGGSPLDPRLTFETFVVGRANTLAHAAALYETLYPVATRSFSSPETPMSVAVDEDRRRIRQGVFDRSGVSYLVSDRVEADPAWPVVFTGTFHEKAFVIHQNPTALPRAYVVPRAEVVEDDDSATALSQFRSGDPRTSVLMTHDPFVGLPPERRQSFTPAHWISQDPDRPLLEVATKAGRNPSRVLVQSGLDDVHGQRRANRRRDLESGLRGRRGPEVAAQLLDILR